MMPPSHSISSSVSTILSLLIVLMLSNMALAQPPRFRPVEGPDLQARMDEALKQARAISPQTRFWMAYAFDVRPGITVDVEVINTNGTTSSWGMAVVGQGSALETRNLGIFLLYEPNTNSTIRLEVYNLDHRREYSGYPVYWLGHARPEESVALLKRLVESNQGSTFVERSIMAIALHDASQQAGALLEQIVRTSSLERARTTAVSWLGHIDGESPFLGTVII